MNWIYFVRRKPIAALANREMKIIAEDPTIRLDNQILIQYLENSLESCILKFSSPAIKEQQHIDFPTLPVSVTLFLWSQCLIRMRNWRCAMYLISCYSDKNTRICILLSSFIAYMRSSFLSLASFLHEQRDYVILDQKYVASGLEFSHSWSIE